MAAADTQLSELIRIMAQLRDPVQGCPWDLEQSFATIAPYTIEEAYEVADAIARDDLSDLCDELGDLLFQVVFHARLAEEAGAFDLGTVAEALRDKLVRRHPHVFGPFEPARVAPMSTPGARGVGNGDQDQLVSKDEPQGSVPELAASARVKHAWEAHKARERAERGARSCLDGVARALPALMRAAKLQRRAARVGFDWGEPEPVFSKVHEELGEVAEAMQAGSEQAVFEEVGDLLFAVANLARHLGVDPEASLRAANAKFERRFRSVEARVAQRLGGLEHADFQALEAAWIEVKRGEGA